MNRLTAFVPLKGHSERVPGKNMRAFGGSPLFHTIVGTLHRAESVDAVFIDTDSDEIEASARALGGVEVIRRRPDLMGDDVSVNLLIESFLEVSGAHHVIQTHATNPLLMSRTIDRAAERYFADDELTSLFAVTRYQARFFDERMRPINHDPTELIPTQRLPPMFMENSNFYIFSAEGFAAASRRITEHTAMFEVDPLEAVDIDEERDFALADALRQVR